MTEIRSKSAIGAHIDVFTDRVHEDVTRTWRAHQQRIEQTLAEIAALTVSRDYTLEGRNKAIDAARAKARAGLKPLRDTVDAVRRRVADEEQSTLAWRETPDKEQHREIRSLLRGKDSLQVFEYYSTAAASGDEQTMRAIEEAPTAFPLLTGDWLAKARAQRAAHSPAAEAVKELHAELQLHADILAAAEEDLREK